MIKMNDEDERERYIACEYCGKKAFYETVTNDMYVCEDEACILEYAMNEVLVNEITEEDHRDYGTVIDEDVEDVF